MDTSLGKPNIVVTEHRLSLGEEFENQFRVYAQHDDYFNFQIRGCVPLGNGRKSRNLLCDVTVSIAEVESLLAQMKAHAAKS